MTSNEPPTLLSIPLEVRHQIFEHVAARDTQPKKLLRYWFEKREVQQKTAELVALDPGVGRLRVVCEGDRSEGGLLEGEESGEEEHEEDEEEGDEEGDEEDAESEEVEGDEAEEQDAEMPDDDSTAVSIVASSTLPIDAQGSTVADALSSKTTTQAPQVLAVPAAAADQTADSTSADQSLTNSVQDATAAQGSTIAATKPGSTAAPTQSHEYADVENADPDTAEDGEEDVDAEAGAAEEEDSQMDDEEGDDEDVNEDADSDSDEEMADGDEDGDTAAGAAQPPLAPIITAHRKWRHIPQFMRITHCPPPVELLLASKQLNIEAKSWFYDVTVLRIEATGSFAHTSFFEEAFSQMTEAAFSPMEDIRRVEITFVWDTTWLRSDRADCAAAIFPALLRQRAIFVAGILAQAPNLSEVTIHWHDSIEDEESVDLMNDVLTGFLALDATVKVEPHYIAADAKPYRKSIAGKQRVEFQRIIDNGLDRLF